MARVVEAGTVSEAAAALNMSQSVLTHAIRSLEDHLGARLFDRHARGITSTGAGRRLVVRVRRALDRLNARMASPVEQHATTAQLRALIALSDSGSFSAAARRLDVAQPTVHRAVRTLEQTLGVTLVQTSAQSVHLTAQGRRLARNARLGFAELEQAVQEIDSERLGGGGRIRIGGLPMARATILAQAVDLALRDAPEMQLMVDDGPYADLLMGVANGTLDLLVGALREPPPPADLAQEPLFDDRLVIFAGPDHPLPALRPLGRTAAPRRDHPEHVRLPQRLAQPSAGRPAPHQYRRLRMFSAVSGSSVATAATIVTVALDEFKRRAYHEPLVLGTIAAGATLGILIPPSVNLIIYGALTNTAIGQLFAAGILPGLLLTALFMAIIAVAATLRPGLAEHVTTAAPRGEKLRRLRHLLPPPGRDRLTEGSRPRPGAGCAAVEPDFAATRRWLARKIRSTGSS